MKEDEIQVLGINKPRENRWVKICVTCIISIVAIIACFYIWSLINEKTSAKEDPTEAVAETRSGRVQNEPRINVLYEEGVMDVPLRIIQPSNMTATLTLDMTALSDTLNGKPLMAIQVQEEGKSTSQNGEGYCAIVNGQIAIGKVDEDDDTRDFCIAKGGAYFRQTPLVIEGVIHKSEAKDKAVRRALAKEDDYVYIIESEKEVSVDDFAKAIAALGVSDVICLPDSPNFFSIHSNEWDYETGRSAKNCSYLIFKP
ncbi:MAG: hypothetical protein IJQ60_15500 [Prevotella sp.]|nr:hypothetical protein [Prevotella sp.]